MKDKNDDKTLELSIATAKVPAKRGRPAIHANNAVRQKAYRARLKARGLREVKRLVPDVRATNLRLQSSIIDLSEVRRTPRRPS
jgi:hypothetical protein